MTAVISMARSLKLRVVAEGVETAEELALLQARQCDERDPGTVMLEARRRSPRRQAPR